MLSEAQTLSPVNAALTRLPVVSPRPSSVEDHGPLVPPGRRGGSPDDVARPETPSRRPETPSRASGAGEEPSTTSSTPTPGRTPGKARQQLDSKAELEKRQGGKPLLNLVVIGG